MKKRTHVSFLSVAFAMLATAVVNAATGDLYVASANNTIERFSPTGTDLGLFASGLNNPKGLAFDQSGNLYVADNGSNTIQRITPGGAVSTFASGLNTPFGLAFDSVGNLYEAD